MKHPIFKQRNKVSINRNKQKQRQIENKEKNKKKEAQTKQKAHTSTRPETPKQRKASDSYVLPEKIQKRKNPA